MKIATAAEHYAGMKAKAEQKINSLQEKTLIRVGAATCGLAAGAQKVKDTFVEEIKHKGLDAEIIEVGCMGHCYAEPMAIISKPGFPALCYGHMDEGLAKLLVEEFLGNDDPCYEYALVALEPNDIFPTFSDFPRDAYEKKIILEHCGFIDPEDIDHYLAREGYASLVKTLQMKPEEIISAMVDSGLRGRGGAGFPVGKKWTICRNTPSEIKYIICNADEGDPGAFMDRSVLESNPHQVIEGMLICAYAVGATKGYIYVRNEYPLAVQRVKTAIEQARKKGLLGSAILDSTFSFDLEVFEGSGAFVCGEESALINSMEGKMGVPQARPPYMAVSGFWGRPTVLNNVKTFAYVTAIIKKGAGWFREIGTEATPGTAVFTLVGKVANTGLVEVPMGTTLRQLVFDIGEGIPNDKEFKAVQIGGPSGGCLPEETLDIPIDFDSLEKAGAIMGSGGLVVLDEDDCMVAIARYFLEFTQQESCGKCTFCRLGTKHMLDILTRITQGKGSLADLDILQELAEDIKMGSLCNLGKTAPNPILTTLRYFRDEYEAHILEGRCPARMCKDLILYYIVPEKCTKLCNVCVGSCPVEAIYTREDGLKAIDQEKCVKCDNCLKTCPPEHNAVIKLSPPVLPEE
ncbi:MAG: NADH-quinone oxidoreductase subunit NuoF [Firmicutes bacterium]|nr:NADH-quinone oxidoreductase subunit NuoF [Bacillota bacterium]